MRKYLAHGCGLTSSIGGIDRWKRLDDNSEHGPEDQDDVRRETNRAKPEGAMPNVVTATIQKTRHGDDVRDVQQDNARSDHAVERCRRAEVQQPHEPDDEAAD